MKPTPELLDKLTSRGCPNCGERGVCKCTPDTVTATVTTSAKSRKPTPRMLFLMTLAERGGIRGSVWQTQKLEPYHSFANIQAVGYADQSRRNPSNREILAMLATGWFEMTPDGCNTTDTRTGAITAVGNRMWLTAAGKKVLECSRQSSTTKPAK